MTRTVLWTHRTQAGRTVECGSREVPGGTEVEIVYDGSILVSRTFEQPGDAELWSREQLELRVQELQKRVRCPRCDTVAKRSPRSGWERLLGAFTSRRPYRCTRCRWRGWRVPD